MIYHIYIIHLVNAYYFCLCFCVVPYRMPYHTYVYLLLGVYRLFSMFSWWLNGREQWDEDFEVESGIGRVDLCKCEWILFVSCWWSLIGSHRNPLVVVVLLWLWSYILCVHLVNFITPTLRKRQMVFCAVYYFVLRGGWGLRLPKDINWWSSFAI